MPHCHTQPSTQPNSDPPIPQKNVLGTSHCDAIYPIAKKYAMLYPTATFQYCHDLPYSATEVSLARYFTEQIEIMKLPVDSVPVSPGCTWELGFNTPCCDCHRN